jgi:hypothetical protein
MAGTVVEQLKPVSASKRGTQTPRRFHGEAPGEWRECPKCGGQLRFHPTPRATCACPHLVCTGTCKKFWYVAGRKLFPCQDKKHRQEFARNQSEAKA